MALFAIYRVRTLGASDAWIGILLTIQRFLSVFVYMILSRILAKTRARGILWVSCLGIALFPLAMALARTPEQLVISAILGGLFAPGVDVFMTNTLFQVSTEEERPTFVATNTLLANVTGFAAPLLGTLLADLTHIRLALFVATGLRLLGGLAFWLLKVGAEDAPASPRPPDAPPV
jgi:predicted MFS family arabinose efflux permease